MKDGLEQPAQEGASPADRAADIVRQTVQAVSDSLQPQDAPASGDGRAATEAPSSTPSTPSSGALGPSQTH